MTRAQKVTLAIFLWLAAIAASSALDVPVATWVRDSGLDAWMDNHKAIAGVWRSPGVYYFTVAVALIVTFIHPLRWRAGGFVLLATLVSGLNGTVKWIVGRTRPFKLDPIDIAAPFRLAPFRGGLAGIMHSKNLCFPSGHAALAFATAAALAMLWPRSKSRWLFYAGATIVALERIAQNAHWVSDTVAAAAMGIGGVHLIHWIVQKVMPANDHG